MGLLRFILALSVVTAHCGAIFGSTFVGGQVAVQSFFIISGFYMSLILNEKYIGVNGAYKLFITNRLIRLYPIFWVVLLLTVLGCLAIGWSTFGQVFPKFGNYLSVKPNFWSFLYLILTNILIFGQDIVLFLGINPTDGSLFFTDDFTKTQPPLYFFLFIPQAWSLGIELAFYLIAPFILRRGTRFVLVLLAFSLLLRLFIHNYLGLQNDPWTYRFFPTELGFFLLGYLSYRLYLRSKTMALSPKISLFALCTLLVFTIGFAFIPSVKSPFFSFTVKECAYFALVALSIPLLFGYFKQHKWDNRIGDLSYPIYISHVMVAMLCQKMHLSSGWLIALMTVLFSVLLNQFVALPIEKYRQSRLA
jgi:peptidoglycan/LPS O-acetylase OafA/YrhL